MFAHAPGMPADNQAPAPRQDYDPAYADGVPNVKKSRWVLVLLWLVPFWLVLSAVGGIWLYFDAQKKKARQDSLKFANNVSAASINADLKTMKSFMPVRDPDVEEGIGLTRAAAWIEGTLGPSNTGYEWKKIAGPNKWPLLHTLIHGTDEKAPPVWIIVPYDSSISTDPFGSDVRRDSDADSSVVALIAAAQSLASSPPTGTLHFVFIPHGRVSGDLVAPTREKVISLIRDDARPSTVLFLDSMGGGQYLSLATRDLKNPVFSAGFGKIVPPTDRDRDTNALFAAGLPAVSISTFAAEEGDAEPLSIATGQLVELIRRLSAKK